MGTTCAHTRKKRPVDEQALQKGQISRGPEMRYNSEAVQYVRHLQRCNGV